MTLVWYVGNCSCMLYCGTNLIHVLCMGCWGVKLQARVCIVVAVLLFRCAKAAVIQPSVQQYTVDWEIFVAINFHGSFELQNFFSG